MIKNLKAKDNLSGYDPDNSSLPADAEETKQMIETAAEQVADLIWRHWLYRQEQKKKKDPDMPNS